jgi:hypothetical protein
MFRVGQKGEGLDDADTIEGAREIVQDEPPGRYDVDEISAEPLPAGHTSRRRGVAVKHWDAKVELIKDQPA